MKTTILLSAIVLMSAASFAQSSASTDANASAQATVKTTSASNARMKAEQEVKKIGKTAKSEKEYAGQQAKTDMKTVKNAADENSQASVSSKTEVSKGTGVKDNKSGKEASLNGQSSTSESADANLTTAGLKADGKKDLNSTTTTVKATDAKAKAVKQEIKVKPAAVKVNTHIAATSAIKIR